MLGGLDGGEVDGDVAQSEGPANPESGGNGGSEAVDAEVVDEGKK